MAGTASDSGASALSLAGVLAVHGAGEVLVLDVSAQAGWTDRFVIATATSLGHLRGLARFIDEEAARLGLRPPKGRKAQAEDDEWLLIDLGDVVVHVMTAAARSFFELEKLWFQSPATRVEPPAPEAGPAALRA